MAAVTLCSDFKAQENKIRHAPQPRSSICRDLMKHSPSITKQEFCAGSGQAELEGNSDMR